jgi:hypothetical protein
MTKIAIPPDLAGMFAACEDAYEQATREGYAENPAVVAAVTALKSAWKALHLANYNYTTTKGFFSVEFAAIRVDRACRASREACIKLHAAIKDAGYVIAAPLSVQQPQHRSTGCRNSASLG